MKKLYLAGLALGLMTTTVLAQADRLVIQSEPAQGGTPAWKLTSSFPDPGGNTLVEADGTVNVIPREQRVSRSLPAGTVATPSCKGSPICGREGGYARNQLARVVYEQNLGYTFSYPYFLPKGFGGVPAVGIDSKGNLWVVSEEELPTFYLVLPKVSVSEVHGAQSFSSTVCQKLVAIAVSPDARPGEP